MDKNKLWVLLKRIPKRKLTTYKILAKKLDTSPRGIGSALHYNKNPDKIPCYKVVMSDGVLGGYALGEKEKIKRLRQEGIIVKNRKIVDFEEKLYTYPE